MDCHVLNIFEDSAGIVLNLIFIVPFKSNSEVKHYHQPYVTDEVQVYRVNILIEVTEITEMTAGTLTHSV